MLFPFNTEALKAHGKGHSVHLSTWGDLDCTNEHPDTQVSHISHMAILFGSNPARLHLASCWCVLKDAKCHLKGEKPAQDGVERLSSWNVILENTINCRGEFQMQESRDLEVSRCLQELGVSHQLQASNYQEVTAGLDDMSRWKCDYARVTC